MASQRIYMGNLPDDIEKQDIEEVLQRACKISPADLPDIVQNVWCAKNPPGFAFVVFSDRKYADIAVEELHQKELFGREIKVEIARENQGERKPRGGSRGGPRDGPRDGFRGGFRGGSRGGFRGGFRDGPPDRRSSRGGFRSPRRSPSPFRSRPSFRRSPSPYRAQGRDRVDLYDRSPRGMPLRNDFSPPRYGGMDDRRQGFGGGRRDEPIRRYEMPKDSYGGGGGYGGGGYGRMQRRSMSPPRRSPPPRFQARRSPPGRSPPRRGRGGGRGRGRGRF